MKQISIFDRLPNSAGQKGFWELAAIITTSDESLTKGHIRYLEAELIRATSVAGRATLENSQKPDAEKRYLPEADRANMLSFLANIATVLPVVGFDFLKAASKPAAQKTTQFGMNQTPNVEFFIEHKSGVKARMIETEDDYIVQKGSLAAKDADHASNTYGSLRQSLIDKGKLATNGSFYVFTDDVPFSSPSAAAAVILDRNSNGRYEWKVVGSKMTYDEWQKTASLQQA